jgi:hypothetical protein
MHVVGMRKTASDHLMNLPQQFGHIQKFETLPIVLVKIGPQVIGPQVIGPQVIGPQVIRPQVIGPQVGYDTM